MDKIEFYTWKKGEKIKLSKNFRTDEFDCKCGYKECVYQRISVEQVNKLQQLRDLTGSLKVTSGFRCQRHNKDVGGVISSQHVLGTAADVTSSKIGIVTLQEFAKKIFNGVGMYNTFTHTDSRQGRKATWDRRSK